MSLYRSNTLGWAMPRMRIVDLFALWRGLYRSLQFFLLQDFVPLDSLYRFLMGRAFIVLLPLYFFLFLVRCSSCILIGLSLFIFIFLNCNSKMFNHLKKKKPENLWLHSTQQVGFLCQLYVLHNFLGNSLAQESQIHSGNAFLVVIL